MYVGRSRQCSELNEIHYKVLVFFLIKRIQRMLQK